MYYFYQTATSLQALLQQFTKVVSGVLVVLVQQCLCSAAEGVFYRAQKALEINRKSRFSTRYVFGFQRSATNNLTCAAPRRFD